MKLSPRRKKWLKWIAILLIIRFVVGGILYYVIVYRFEDILRIAVNRESNGLYSFKAKHIEVSLFKKTIELDHISLTCNDTLKTENYYAVDIPKVYLSIESFRDLVFRKTLSVDSMAVLHPAFTAHVKPKQLTETTELSLQASRFMEILQKVVLHLKIRTFKISDASFAYYQNRSGRPFTGSNVNFSVSNFSKKDSVRAFLFAADDIDLLITDQHWVLPDSVHQISFSRLHFSGKDQKFEIDSCVFQSQGNDEQNSLRLDADRIFFNSNNLQNTYLKEELNIDTISFFHPVLAVQSASSKTTDTAAAINSAMRNLFRRISFNYIDIMDGQFSFGKKSGIQNNYQSQKSNLRAYNLALIPGGKPGLTLDSINLKLNKINFFTKDSLNQLSIGEFVLNKNRLVLRDAEYGPTPINRNQSALKFATPVLEIEDVSIDDLIKKRLVGTVAELREPVINVTGGSRNDGAVRNRKGMKDFFNTLHNLQEIIEVDSIRIMQGRLNYHLAKNNIKAVLKGLNATVMINRFLRSDSLIDVKRSIPKLSVSEILLTTPKLSLVIDHYQFLGNVRYNESAGFRLRTGNTSLTGTGVNWKIFDWDMFANHKQIQIQELYISKLSAKIAPSDNTAKSDTQKDLPVINIGRLDIESLDLEGRTAKDENYQLEGRDICLDEISSNKQFLQWNNLLGQLSNIKYEGTNFALAIQGFSLDNTTDHRFHQLSASTADGRLKFAVPSLRVKLPLHSSDFSNERIESLVFDKPSLIIVADSGNSESSSSFAMPFDLRADKIEWKDGSVRYVKKDIEIETKVNLNLRDINVSKSGTAQLTFSTAQLGLNEAKMRKGQFDGSIDSAAFTFRKGVVGNGISTALSAAFSGLSAHMRISDSTSIDLHQLKASFQDENFAYARDKKPDWKEMLEKTNITGGSGQIATRHFTAAAASLKWDGMQKELHSGEFSLLPKISREDASSKAEWQSDYMTVKGRNLSLKGLNLIQRADDSLLHVDRIDLDQVALMTSRDKRLPLKHGIEKLMPTQLINNIKYPFEVDSLFLKDSKVEVREFSAVTGQEAVIPLSQVNAVISNIKSKPQAADSLRITASAMLMDNYINELKYSESYGDSLSYFTLKFHASPMILPLFSKATKPLAAVQLNSGKSDTLYANWVGNKYAAIGKMNFVYRNLSIRILDKENFGRKRFKLSIGNFLANTFVLRRKNKKESIVFFERDKEKFIFNYWVKTSLKGLMGSVGLKRNRKSLKEFAAKQAQYSLPDMQ